MRLTPETRLDSLADLIASWDLPACDILIAGDGSGQTWEHSCGWGGVLIDVRSGHRRVFYGAMNLGTSALAELLPSLHALTWYEAVIGPARRQELGRPLKVTILTDASHFSDQGNRLMRREKGIDRVAAFPGFWAALLDFERRGYELNFVWKPRLSSALNSYCDDLAGQSSRSIRTDGTLDSVTKPRDAARRPVKVGECNPSDGRVSQLEDCKPQPKSKKKSIGPDDPVAA